MDNDTMLTTYDNPLNPFEDFIGWFKMDHLLGHNTCEILSIYAGYDSNVGDQVNEEYIDQAMETIVSLEPTIYRIVTKDDYKQAVNLAV